MTHVSILTRDTSDERRARAQALQAEQQVRLMEAKLEQSANLEPLGKLAGGIAHDFNTLLTAVACVAEVLTTRFEPGDPSAVDLADLRDAVARGARLTRQLLTFSRQQPVTLTTVDLNILLDEMGRLLRQLIGADIELRLAIASEPFLVRGDRSQLEQVPRRADPAPGGTHGCCESRRSSFRSFAVICPLPFANAMAAMSVSLGPID